jgi:HK97 gp10 family phage protein
MAVETVRIEGLEGVMKTLRELPPELVSKRGGPVRTALRNASKILVEEARSNVQRIIDEPNIDGMPTKSIGLLKNSIVTVRNSRMRVKGERYYVRVSRKKYPAGRSDKTATGVGALLEHGTERRRPMPWLRPAFDTKKNEAVQQFPKEMRRQLDRITKKLARQNGVA